MRTFGLHLAVWTAIALIAASQTMLTYLATGGPVAVGPVILLSLALWYSWAALSPVIWWAARRLPLYGRGWPLRVLAHLGINLILAVVAAMVYRVLRFAIGLPPRGDYAVLIASGLNTALLVYWGLVAIAHAAAYYRRTETRRRAAVELDRQLALARLNALRAQIQPHFLFNTLNAIAAQVRQDPRGAEDMLGELGELLRTGLHSAPVHEIPLAEELALVERYIAIQRTRLQERMRVELEIDPAALPALVPVLFLQPLVENAIEHGIAQRLAGGTLRITARVASASAAAGSVGAHIIVQVIDQGGEPEPERLDGARWGIGLSNTRARLAQLYGDAAALGLEAVHGGVTATVRLPFRTVASSGAA
jgi:hypothetical protein